MMKINIRWFVVLLLVFFSGCGNDNVRHTTRILIPEGYVGWIRVEYRVEGADPLPVEWRLPPPMMRNREVIPTSGLLLTSTALGYTFGGDLYFYNDHAVWPAGETKTLCYLTSQHNFEFTDPNEKQQFITYFVGPPSEEHRCEEMERFKTGERFPVYAAPNLAALPAVGNVKTQIR